MTSGSSDISFCPKSRRSRWTSLFNDFGKVVKPFSLNSKIFSLDNHQANALLEEGKILVNESVGLQQFTSLLNENLAADQKFSIILALWEVARNDDLIDALEEHQIRNISELLYVPHSKFIEAKLSTRKPQN